jgi:hypothetical protein
MEFSLLRAEKTEDGDLAQTWRATGTPAEIKTAIREGRKLPGTWRPAGDGRLTGEFYNLVDGTEIAIEKSNDYRAWCRDAGAPEWAL